MLGAVMLSVVYVKCHKKVLCFELSVIVQNGVMQKVVMLNVVAML
jgi:hypothetical protein